MVNLQQSWGHVSIKDLMAKEFICNNSAQDIVLSDQFFKNYNIDLNNFWHEFLQNMQWHPNKSTLGHKFFMHLLNETIQVNSNILKLSHQDGNNILHAFLNNIYFNKEEKILFLEQFFHFFAGLPLQRNHQGITPLQKLLDLKMDWSRELKKDFIFLHAIYIYQKEKAYKKQLTSLLENYLSFMDEELPIYEKEEAYLFFKNNKLNNLYKKEEFAKRFTSLNTIVLYFKKTEGIFKEQEKLIKLISDKKSAKSLKL